MQTGTVKRFNGRSGFGFIQRDARSGKMSAGQLQAA
jgi:cold shock CspA family protein